jgi:hypothetical protein
MLRILVLRRVQCREMVFRSRGEDGQAVAGIGMRSTSLRA